MRIEPQLIKEVKENYGIDFRVIIENSEEGIERRFEILLESLKLLSVRGVYFIEKMQPKMQSALRAFSKRGVLETEFLSKEHCQLISEAIYECHLFQESAQCMIRMR